MCIAILLLILALAVGSTILIWKVFTTEDCCTPGGYPKECLDESESKHMEIPEITHDMIKYFRRAIDEVSKIADTTIPPVKCPISFAGCGYVEGRTEGVKIGKDMVLVEGDNDLGWHDACLIIKGYPALDFDYHYNRDLELMLILDIPNRRSYKIVDTLRDLPEDRRKLCSVTIHTYIEKHKKAYNRISVYEKEVQMHVNATISEVAQGLG